MLVVASREIVRDIHDGLYKTRVQIIDCARKRIVPDHAERLWARGDSVEHLLDPARLDGMIFVDEGNVGILDLSAEGIAKHHQLHERKNERTEHQRRAAEELPQVPFNQCRYAIQLHLSGSS